MEEVGTRRMIAVRMQRNLEHAEGNELGPFLSFSDALVASKIHDLRITLGNNSSAVSGSTTKIAKLKLDRFKSSTTTEPTFTIGPSLPVSVEWIV
jgi:hypothetical protein